MTDKLYPLHTGEKRKLVDMGDGSHAEQIVARPPQSLMTGTTNPRLRVDVAETGFFEKREFRTYREFSQPLGTHIVNGQRVLVRFISPINFILMDFRIVGDNGQIRAVSYAGGTPSGTFSINLPVIPANGMTEGPAPYASQMTVAMTPSGASPGTGITGGAERDVIRLKIENSTGAAASVGNQQDSERGLPAAIYYVLIDNIGTGVFEGVVYARWEERP